MITGEGCADCFNTRKGCVCGYCRGCEVWAVLDWDYLCPECAHIYTHCLDTLEVTDIVIK